MSWVSPEKNVSVETWVSVGAIEENAMLMRVVYSDASASVSSQGITYSYMSSFQIIQRGGLVRSDPEGQRVVYLVVDLAHPAVGAPGRGDDDATGRPERRQGQSSGLDGPPCAPPAPPGLLVEHLVPCAGPTHGRRGEAGPLCGAPDHVAASRGDESGVGAPGEDAVAGEAVADVGEANVGAVALDPEREQPVHGDVGGEGGGEDVARDGDPAEGRPGTEGGALFAAAVASDVLGAADEAESGARGDVGGDGEEDEEGLGEGGLVDLAGLEEVGLGGGDGCGQQRDEAGVDKVDGGEHGDGVGGVALDAGDW